MDERNEHRLLGAKIADVATRVARQRYPHAAISADGYSEIGYRNFVIRLTTPFSRRAVGYLPPEPRRYALPLSIGQYRLEIVHERLCVFRAWWDCDIRNMEITWHMRFVNPRWEWEEEFLREEPDLDEGQPMARNEVKRQLRRFAKIAIEQHGFTTDDVGGAGIAPGVRLLARKGSIQTQIAVRTSHDRKVGLTRTDSGKWRTIPKVDEVLVAAVANDDPTQVEVFCFESKVLLRAFNRLLNRQQDLREGPDGNCPPIFIALDPLKADKQGIKSNLKDKAKWSQRLPLTLSESPAPSASPLPDFLARARKEYAAIVGVDPSDVDVEFRVIGRAQPAK